MGRARVVVTGRVQGVFYRDTCRREAHRLAVTGWVRNRADGAVEAVFEGPEDAIGAMVEWCKHGPRHARVEGVQVYEEEAAGMTGFVVRMD